MGAREDPQSLDSDEGTDYSDNFGEQVGESDATGGPIGSNNQEKESTSQSCWFEQPREGVPTSQSCWFEQPREGVPTSQSCWFE